MLITRVAGEVRAWSTQKMRSRGDRRRDEWGSAGLPGTAGNEGRVQANDNDDFDSRMCNGHSRYNPSVSLFFLY